MSESSLISPTNAEPQTVFLKNYQLPTYLIDEIELNFDLDDDHTIVKSHMRIRRNRQSSHPGRDLRLQGEELLLVSIELDGKPLAKSQYELSDKMLLIHDVPDNFEIEIITQIFPQKNTALSGLYRSAKTYCTQCEAEGFRRITYFLDQPDILTRYTTTITADAARYPYLLSNGNLIEAGKLDQGKHYAKWEDPFKKPCYLFALVAGDFDLIEDNYVTQSGREITLRIYVEKGYGDQADHAMYSLIEAMRWDEKAYGREYDLDVYMIVAIGDFNMGAMENKGLNIFNTKYILAKPETATDDDYIHILSVVGHEYFHNWSGNRVTCRDWFQLSLKEGLTIFRDQSFSEDVMKSAVMRIQEVTYLREIQFPEDAGPLSHPVRPDSYIEINNFYTATVYNKGAELLRMLQTILGKALFRKGMDLYFARHDGQAVTIEDFVKTMEDVSGIDLKQFRRWYSERGTPIVQVEDDYDPQQKIYTLTFNQSVPAVRGHSDQQPLHIPVRLELLDRNGGQIPLHINDEPVDTEQVLNLREAMQSFKFTDVATRPIASLFRNFSAPVKVNYPFSDEDLEFLFKHDTDPFNRWDAGQKYALRQLLSMVRDYQQSKALHLPPVWPKMFEYILQNEKSDKYLLSEMLTLPSEKYIAEQMEVIDVNAIHAVREFVLNGIAEHVQALFLEVYKANHGDSLLYQFNTNEVGKRQLKNRCLAYLMQLPQHANLGMQQFSAALESNMTDTQPALMSLVNLNIPERQKALDLFYTTWKHDALVVDKWLSIQAACKLPTTLQQVRKLLTHEAFDLKNPNKVYSLIGTFAHRNPVNFHAETGEGYALLAEVIQQLDKLNPQVAARMIKPLTTWRRYDNVRQEMMQKQLEKLLKDNKLSPDLYEMVTKSLE